MLAGTHNLKAQSCANATIATLGVAFEYYEEQGKSYVLFEATNANMNLFLNWDITSVTPIYYALYSGNCRNLTFVEGDSLTEGYEPFWNFKFSNLNLSTQYYLALSEPSGFGGAGQLAVAPGNSYVCAPTNNCDYILNGGFEQFDPYMQIICQLGKLPQRQVHRYNMPM